MASRETIRFLTLRLLMICKIQRSWRQFRDVTVIWSFQTGLDTFVRGPCQFSTPLFPLLTTLSIYAATEGLGGAPKLILSPGAGNSRYVTDIQVRTYNDIFRRIISAFLRIEVQQTFSFLIPCWDIIKCLNTSVFQQLLF